MSDTVIEEAKKTTPPHADPVSPVRDMVHACIQCGTCSGSCPNAFAMDMTPRAMWRRVLVGEITELFDSKTFMLCSDCYYCTLRCPRGLPLTDAMAALKRIAAVRDDAKNRPSTRFYRSFLESVRKHGRVHETEFMTHYFLSMKNPVTPLRFAPLGMKLMARGKISPGLPLKRASRLSAIFRKSAQLEEVI